MDEQERTLVQGRMRAAHPILNEGVGSVALAQSNFQSSCRRSPPKTRPGGPPLSNASSD